MLFLFATLFKILFFVSNPFGPFFDKATEYVSPNWVDATEARSETGCYWKVGSTDRSGGGNPNRSSDLVLRTSRQQRKRWQAPPNDYARWQRSTWFHQS